MIRSDSKNGLKIEGNIREVSAECILIMREIFKKNVETYGKEVATGILTNMLIRAIIEEEGEVLQWQKSEEEKLAYTD